MTNETRDLDRDPITPEPCARAQIKYLAQQCANGGLRFRDAQLLFYTMYWIDAIIRGHGSQTRAARMAGQKRAAFIRFRARAEKIVGVDLRDLGEKHDAVEDFGQDDD